MTDEDTMTFDNKGDICDWCGKKKNPYMVVMDSNALSIAMWMTEHMECVMCEECFNKGYHMEDLPKMKNRQIKLEDMG